MCPSRSGLRCSVTPIASGFDKAVGTNSAVTPPEAGMSRDFISALIDRAEAGSKARMSWATHSRAAATLRRTADSFINNNDLLWASALTYTTGLSIVPVLAVALSALNGLGDARLIRPLIERYVGANSPQITDRLLDFVSNVNAGTLGTVGGVSLLITVILTLGTIEQALNNIFHVRRGRTIARKFADYLSVTFAVPVFLAGAIAIHQILADRLPNVSAARWISSSLAIWAGFFFLYMFFPNRRVRLEAAAIGSLVAAILLQSAQSAFIYFQYGVAQYASIYGALASVPILLTWIYLTWLAVLLGAELTAAFERRNEPLIPNWLSQRDRAVALVAILRLGERMTGRLNTITPQALAEELKIEPDVLAEVLRRLEHAGIVVEGTAADSNHRGLFLARDSNSIELREVLDCVDTGLEANVTDIRAAALLQQLRSAECEMLDGLTVRDLVEHRETIGDATGPRELAATWQAAPSAK
jgi:membrane protein